METHLYLYISSITASIELISRNQILVFSTIIEVAKGSHTIHSNSWMDLLKWNSFIIHSKFPLDIFKQSLKVKVRRIVYKRVNA